MHPEVEEIGGAVRGTSAVPQPHGAASAEQEALGYTASLTVDQRSVLVAEHLDARVLHIGRISGREGHCAAKSRYRARPARDLGEGDRRAGIPVPAALGGERGAG